MRKLLIYLLLFSSIIVLARCGEDKANNAGIGDARPIRLKGEVTLPVDNLAKVMTIEALLFDFEGGADPVVISSCNVVDNAFKIKLPTPIDLPYLTAIDNVFNGTKLSIDGFDNSNPTAEGIAVDLHAKLSSQKTMRIVQAAYDGDKVDLSKKADVYCIYVYSNAPCRIKGSRVDELESMVLDCDMALDKGWNRIFVFVSEAKMDAIKQLVEMRHTFPQDYAFMWKVQAF